MVLISCRSWVLKAGFIFRIFYFRRSRSLIFRSSFLMFLVLSCLNSTSSALRASSTEAGSSGMQRFFACFSSKYAFSSSRITRACFRSILFSQKSSSPRSCCSSSFSIVPSTPPKAALSSQSFSSFAKGFSFSFFCFSSSWMRDSSVQSLVWKIRRAPETQMYSQFSGSVRTTKRCGHWGHFMRNSQIWVEWKLPVQVLMELKRTPFATMFWQPSHRTWKGVSYRTFEPPTRCPSTTTNGFSSARSLFRGITFEGSKFLGLQQPSALAAAKELMPFADLQQSRQCSQMVMKMNVALLGRVGVEGRVVRYIGIQWTIMRFICGECANCCKTESAFVSYCQSQTQCFSVPLPFAFAIGVCVAVIFIAAATLYGLYYCCRSRPFDQKIAYEHGHNEKMEDTQQEERRISIHNLPHQSKQRKVQSFSNPKSHLSIHKKAHSQRRLT